MICFFVSTESCIASMLGFDWQAGVCPHVLLLANRSVPGCVVVALLAAVHGLHVGRPIGALWFCKENETAKVEPELGSHAGNG